MVIAAIKKNSKAGEGDRMKGFYKIVGKRRNNTSEMAF